MSTTYANSIEITELQQEIMRVINDWVHIEKTPIPLKEIMNKLEAQGSKTPTIINAIHGLLKQGYIRRAYITSNKTYFVQLRTI